MSTCVSSGLRAQVGATLSAKPVIGVVRTSSFDEGRRQADLFLDAGLGLVEITFSVPRATDLVRELRERREQAGPPWIGMGTVTTEERARAAVAAGAEFVVSPNLCRRVAAVARDRGLYLVLGALTASEIVDAHTAGADIVKVYPLPPVGGASYLATVRQPLSDIPMLAAGGFGVEEIPDYRAAGAQAFGMGGGPLMGTDDDDTRRLIRRALALARGERPE